MPIYEYACGACGHQMEAIRKISDKPLIDCPACEKPELKKQVSAAAFRLKGSGWYETDFKKDGKKNLAGDDNKSPSSSSSSSSSETKAKSTESKSADAKPKPKASSET